MGREQDVKFTIAEKTTVVGTTPQAFTPLPCQEGWLIKYQALGGTLEFLGSTGLFQGLSYPVKAYGSGYLMDVGEALSIDGPAAFYMASGGTTSAIQVIRTLTAGANSTT